MRATTMRRQDRDISLRHALATLAYRAAKVLRGAPGGFSGFRPAPGSRSAGEILAHMSELMEWVLSQARGAEAWRPIKPGSWRRDTARFFEGVRAFDRYLASRAVLRTDATRMFQGAVADALTHVGQIAMLRRLAGSPVRGENYSRAPIRAGRIGANQPSD